MVKPLSTSTVSMPNFYYKVNHIKKITKFRLKKNVIYIILDKYIGFELSFPTHY